MQQPLALREQKAAHKEVATKLQRSTEEIERIDKHLNFLEEVYLVLQDTQDVKMSKRLKEHGLHSSTSVAMVQIGLVERLTKGKHTKYNWVHDEVPDFQCAEVVYDLAQLMQRSQQKKHQSTAAAKKISEQKLASLRKRNLVPIDRNAVTHSHVITRTAEKIRRTYSMLEHLQKNLQNCGWVRSSTIQLGSVPDMFGVSKASLLALSPEVLETRGSGLFYEVRWAADNTVNIDMAATIVEKERQYVERITYQDPELTNRLVEAGMEVIDIQRDAERDAGEEPITYNDVELAKQEVLDAPATAVDAPPVIPQAEAPEAVTEPVCDQAEETGPEPRTETLETTAVETTDQDARHTMIELAKMFVQVGEYKAAHDLMTRVLGIGAAV